ncbi:hypothetical protein Tco_1430175 [Tanacetum coccineum]
MMMRKRVTRRKGREIREQKAEDRENEKLRIGAGDNVEKQRIEENREERREAETEWREEDKMEKEYRNEEKRDENRGEKRESRGQDEERERGEGRIGT